MKTRSIFVGTILVAALAVATPGLAQQGTVTTASGERVSGHIRDMDKSGFTVDVAGTERRIMIPEIAVVDFAGTSRNPTADELNRVRQGRQMVVLKDGTALVGEIVEYERTMPGRLADLPKDHAFRIRFQNDGGGERSFLSSEVARIYFKDPSNSLTEGTQGQQPSTGTADLVVSADRPWTATGMVVRRGERIRFQSSGRIQLTPDGNDAAQPAGSLTGRYAASAPLPRALAGALIGRVGDGPPFLIGEQATISMPEAGQLFLGVNDDGFNDNSGQFNVVINRQTVRRR